MCHVLRKYKIFGLMDGWMNETLKCYWGKIYFAIQMACQIMHLETICLLPYAYFHSSLTYDVIFWANSPKAKQVLMLQNRTIRIMMKISQMASSRNIFNMLHILQLPCIYIYETLLYIKTNLERYKQIQIFLSMIQETRKIFLLYLIPPVYLYRSSNV